MFNYSNTYWAVEDNGVSSLFKKMSIYIPFTEIYM